MNPMADAQIGFQVSDYTTVVTAGHALSPLHPLWDHFQPQDLNAKYHVHGWA